MPILHAGRVRIQGYRIKSIEFPVFYDAIPNTSARYRLFRHTLLGEAVGWEFLIYMKYVDASSRPISSTGQWTEPYSVRPPPKYVKSQITGVERDLRQRFILFQLSRDCTTDWFSSIHSPNGNGCYACLFTDAFLHYGGARPFTWGSANLVDVSATRSAYIEALRAADNRDYGPLFAFVRT